MCGRLDVLSAPQPQGHQPLRAEACPPGGGGAPTVGLGLRGRWVVGGAPLGRAPGRVFFLWGAHPVGGRLGSPPSVPHKVSRGVVGAWGHLEADETACSSRPLLAPARSCARRAGGCGGHRTWPGWGEGRAKRRYLATAGPLPVCFFLLNTHFILFFVLLCVWEGGLGSLSPPASAHPVPRVLGGAGGPAWGSVSQSLAGG